MKEILGSDGTVLYYDCGDYVTFVKLHQIIHLKEVSVYASLILLKKRIEMS